MGTVWPSVILISFSTPAEGDGISASTLSVEISKSGSSRPPFSPGFFNHLVMVPSKMLSPIWGMTTSTAMGLFSLPCGTSGSRGAQADRRLEVNRISLQAKARDGKSEAQNRACPHKLRTSGLRGKNKIHGLWLGRRHGNVLGLRAKALVPGGQRVMPGRQFRQTEVPGIVGNREEAVLHNREVSLHPWVNVAFHRNKLFLLVGIRKGRDARRLNFVPLAINAGNRVDVVRERVAVGNFNFLADAECQHMRGVVAALLVENSRRRGRR